MNYLEICRRTNAIVGFQGTISSVAASGYQETLTTAVRDAFEDIQRYRKDWDWMKATRTINVSSVKEEYTLEELWSGDTVDLSEYRYINYDYDRLQEIAYDQYVGMDFRSPGLPRLYSTIPWSKNLLISPLDTVYTLNLHYIKTLQELRSNIDVPRLPVRHHQLIVYMAVMKLSTFIGNATLYDTYSDATATAMGQLLREENPYREVRKRPIA